MATVFFAWELGTGLGQVTQIAPLANALVRRGHTVYAALRELKSANGFFDAGVHLLGAPHLGRALRSPRPAAAVLLAGRPSLHFPLYFEHAVNARCVERLGAGRSCAPGDPSKAVENLRDFLGSDAYTVGAEAFARRYAAFDANRQHEEMLGALLKVIEKGQPGG